MKNVKNLSWSFIMTFITITAFSQEVKYEDIQKGLITKGQYES